MTLRRLRLQHLLFLVLLLTGIIPLAIISGRLIAQNREILRTQEKSHLTRSAASLSVELNDWFISLRLQLRQLGEGFLALPGADSAGVSLRQPWVPGYMRRSMAANPDLVVLRVLAPDGTGVGPVDLGEQEEASMDAAFGEALGSASPIYRFVRSVETGDPRLLAAVPVPGPAGAPALVVEAMARLDMLRAVFEREAQGEVAVFLIDRAGELLWAEGADPAVRDALRGSELVRDFAQRPLPLTREYALPVEGKARLVQARVSPVPETGWGVVVQKPAAAAFTAVRDMVFDTLLSTALLVAVAFVIAAVAARRVSRPIRRLADTTHEIAAGKFGQEVVIEGPGLEVATLAEDFNRMSGHLQKYVAELQRAARVNEELFIGSIRAVAAAVDAKDPYTRGHAERVASYSRVIARHLGLPDAFQHQVWVGALLHDVGKIGVDDRILRKGGALTPPEREEMNRHTVIGAEILSPIEQLRPMLLAVRSHHEAWSGGGYPDGLKGEQIPLVARIVAVADCFDAVTTHRPYQRGYTSEFALETITKLAGSRFDAKVVSAFLRAFHSGEIQDRRQETPAAEALEAAAKQSMFSYS